MSERTYHHGNLRSALLQRAWDVVDSEGADALSLRQLARDVGVSHGASARHFRDKAALLDALAVEGFARMNAALTDASTRPGTFSERFAASGRAYVGFAVTHPAVLAVMYSAKHHPDASAELRALSHIGMTGLIALVAEGQDAGEVRGGAPEQHALVAFAAVHGVATLATDDLLDGVPWESAADSVIGFVHRGLAVADPS